MDAEAVQRGREAFGRNAWKSAHEHLSAADAEEKLGAEDLEFLATAAFMLGRGSEYLDTLERAHRAHLDAGEKRRAFRCAFWIGINLARGGEMARAGGWLGRAQRLMADLDSGKAERGYLQLPEMFERAARGDLTGAAEVAEAAAAIGQATGDKDLFALAAHEQGHLLVRAGDLRRGVILLDEAMVSVIAGELSPIVSGIVYCGVILACQEAHEVRRAAEWTAALSAWCEKQPDLVAFTGRCLVHRSEILALRGSWPQALGEARKAGERSQQAGNQASVGDARYCEGEIHRLLGELDEAEAAYRKAGKAGREPQPGLALLRLAQRRSDAAETAIRRLLAETSEPAKRVEILPPAAEVLLAVGDSHAAREVADELDQLAQKTEANEWLGVVATATRGAVELAAGDPETALPFLRAAVAGWHKVGSPYEAARVRALIGSACRMIGDEDSALIELDGARDTFTELGARTDLERLSAADQASSAPESHGLTARETEVLRCVAAGSTNKQIAAELVLSVRTVDRHVSNIFAKLDVPNRAAAATFAHEHKLV